MMPVTELAPPKRQRRAVNGHSNEVRNAFPTEQPVEPATPTMPSRRPWTKPLIFGALGVGLAVAVITIVRFLGFAATHASTDDAAVATDVVQVAPQVSGTVKQLLVSDNQSVKAGDLLLVLDDSTYRTAVDQAQANLDMAIAQAGGANVTVALTAETGNAQTLQAQGVLEQAKSGIASAFADVAKSEAAIANARAMAKASDAGINTAQAAVETAKANRKRAVDAIASAQAQLETSKAAVLSAQSAVDSAKEHYQWAIRDSKRYASLVAEGAVSGQTADQAGVSERQAKAQLDNTIQQVAQAQAVVSQRQADLNSAREQVNVADANIAQANAQLAAAREQSVASGAGIRQAIASKDAARQSAIAAQARRQQAEGQLIQAQTAPRQVAVSRSASTQASARIEQAKAALEAAKIQLAYTRIYAPSSGRITKKSVEAGALVQPGTPLLALVPQDKVWVVANFKETQVGKMHPGQRAKIEVDALPGKPLTGKVDSLAAGTGSAFALLPADNATGNFTKVVQRVPVKIVLDPGQPGFDRLGTGMSVTATVETK